MPISQSTRRAIAENLVQQLGEVTTLPASPRDLATSIVRQWLTEEGHAVVLTHKAQFCLTMHELEGNQAEVGLKHVDLESELVPHILEELNLCQTAAFTDPQGKRLRARVRPKERKIVVEPEELV